VAGGEGALQRLTWKDLDGSLRSSADPAEMAATLDQAPALLAYGVLGSGGLLAAAEHLGLSYAALADKTRDLSVEGRLAFPPVDAGSGSKGYELTDLASQSLPTKVIRLAESTEDAAARSVELLHALGAVLRVPDKEYARREHRIASVASVISQNGLRFDERLLAPRREARSRRSAQIRELLVDSYGFPATAIGGDPSKRPWATTSGGNRFLELVADRPWPRNANGSPVLKADELRRGSVDYAGTPLGEVCKLVGEGQAGNSFLDQASAAVVNGRLHPVYGLDTSTGRWTSTRPNILGVGKRSELLLADRDLILAEEGDVLIGVDLSGIDARCVAGLSGDASYAELFRPGVDIHAEMAELFLGDRSMREPAKAITHGINYGRGPAAIAAQTGRGVTEVRGMHRAYFGRFPGIAAWHSNIRRQGGAGALLPTGTGRLVRVNPANAYTEAPARLAQSAARDVAMTGLLRLVDAGLLPMLRLFIHDEVVLSVPRAQAEDIAARVAQLLSFDWTSPSGLVIPIVAEPSKGFGPRWSDVYRKPTSP